jgi:hypothetical protein
MSPPNPRSVPPACVRASPVALAVAAAVALASPGPASAAARGQAPVAPGEAFARVSVTLEPDDAGVVRLPGPFVVLPDGERLAIHVPEANGIFILRGDRILHHFPLPEGIVLDDLEASTQLLVAARRLAPPRRETVELHPFGLRDGRRYDIVRSANPYLRLADGPAAGSWRVVVEGTLVGVYHPPSAATYPLWDARTGAVPGTDQIARARAGIGLEEGGWVPRVDGSLERNERGRTVPIADGSDGRFVDGPAPDVAVLLRGDGEEVPETLEVLVLQDDVAISPLHLPAIAPGAPEGRYTMAGNPVRALHDRIFWIRVGHDYVEIRATSRPVPVPARAGSAEDAG